jgi:replication-associated recombination protein RarA
MAYEMKTINGFDYYEAMSAFQKGIRRCDEDETVFWGIELYDSNYIGHLWNRILIIAHEDIGLAEPNFTAKVIAFKQAHDYLEKHRPKKVSKKLVMLQTFIELARAKKSRYVDLSYSVYWSLHSERAKTRKVPDYAFDMHTKRGKMLRRGLDHFYSEGALINNRAEVEGELLFEQLARQIDQDEQDAAKLLKQQEQSKTQAPNPNLFDI